MILLMEKTVINNKFNPCIVSNNAFTNFSCFLERNSPFFVLFINIIPQISSIRTTASNTAIMPHDTVEYKLNILNNGKTIAAAVALNIKIPMQNITIFF